MQQQRNNSFIYKVTLVAAVGGLLFGYDTAVIAGAIGFMQKYYNLSCHDGLGCILCIAWLHCRRHVCRNIER